MLASIDMKAVQRSRSRHLNESCVNAIAPDMFRIRMTEAILDRAEAVVAGMMPMGRIGQPGELTPTVLFLALEGASYITGQVVAIDGGERHNRKALPSCFNWVLQKTWWWKGGDIVRRIRACWQTCGCHNRYCA